jgi:hypothetical protein
MAIPSNRQKMYCYLWTTLVYGRVNTALRSVIRMGEVANLWPDDERASEWAGRGGELVKFMPNRSRMCAFVISVPIPQRNREEYKRQQSRNRCPLEGLRRATGASENGDFHKTAFRTASERMTPLGFTPQNTTGRQNDCSTVGATNPLLFLRISSAPTAFSPPLLVGSFQAGGS